MYKDKEKFNQYIKDKTTCYNLRITNSTGIPDTLKQMSADTGKSETALIREAVLEKIQRDGYTITPKNESVPQKEVIENVSKNSYIKQK